MESGVNEEAEIDYNLATQPDTYVRLMAGNPQLVDLLRVVEAEDKRALDEWEEWLPELEMMLHNRVAHGLGIFHFPHPVGWHSASLHLVNLITPPLEKNHPSKWPWFAIKTEFDIPDLLARLGDPEASAIVGWNVRAIRKAIAKFAQNGGAQMVSRIARDMENYVLELRSTDLAFAQENNQSIPGYIFDLAEWDGGVSEYFLTGDPEVGFLFKGVKHRQSIAEVIALFPLSLGQGYIDAQSAAQRVGPGRAGSCGAGGGRGFPVAPAGGFKGSLHDATRSPDGSIHHLTGRFHRHGDKGAAGAAGRAEAGTRRLGHFIRKNHFMRREVGRSRPGVPGCKPGAVRDGEGCFKLYSTRSVRRRYRNWTPCSNWNF